MSKTDICGLNVEMFEAYFGYEATGKQETGAGAPQDPVFPSDLLAFPHSHCSVVLTHWCVVGNRSVDVFTGCM